MAWKRVMKAEPIDWLLEHQDPSIRFWALQDLESRGLDHPEVQDAQDALMERASALLNSLG